MELKMKHDGENAMRTETVMKERPDFTPASPASQIRQTRSTGPTFECEEGEGGSAVPMPGLLCKPKRLRQTEANRHYTSEDARRPVQWEPDLNAARREWTDDDGPATAMPGLIVRPDATVSLKVEQPRARGLCTTCELRETCTFTRPESGVWRCEEYR